VFLRGFSPEFEMMNEILRHSLLYGVVLSVLSSAVLLISAYLNPESMVDDYPADIRARHGEMSEKARRHKRLVGIPFGVVLIGILVVSIITLRNVTGGELTFAAVFINVAVILILFNLVDLLIIDWLIFNTIQPHFIVLPGTEGMAGYRDYGFHFRAFLKGTAGSLIVSAVITGIVVVIEAIR